MHKKEAYKLFAAAFLLLAVSFISTRFTWIIDLTSDHRYTLSENTKTSLLEIRQPVIIDVLLGGDLPPEYLRLRSELEVLLNQFKSINPLIQYDVVDPFKGATQTEALVQELYEFGLNPEISIDQENQSSAQTIVVPWLILNSENNSSRVALLQKNLGDTPEQRIEQSIEQLEYQLLDGFHKLLLKKKKRIAVISSHQTSEDVLLASFLNGLLPYYNIASFDLKAFPDAPEKTLENLLRFDLIMVSNPKEKFSPTEKFMLDQFTQQGKSSLYLIDPVQIASDSLFGFKGNSVAVPYPIELDELFFKYGVRLNQDLVKDLYSAPIVLAQGENAKSQYQPFPWTYHPLNKPAAHPIGNAISNVLLRFSSSIDTLSNPLKKTILLGSSERSLSVYPPVLIELEEATRPLKPSSFNESNKITGVLLEGEFPSLFKNRISPFEWEKIANPKAAKTVIFSDGNLAENQVDKGKPLDLGYDKWTNNLYGNMAFLQNTIHYLMGESKRLMLRSKEVRLAFLDRTLINEDKSKIQLLALGIPLLFLVVLGGGASLWRKKQSGQ